MTNSDASAFPIRKYESLPSGETVCHPEPNGLTKREYFAVMALNGLVQIEQPIKINGKQMPIEEAAVYVADALLAALNKKS